MMEAIKEQTGIKEVDLNYSNEEGMGSRRA